MRNPLRIGLLIFSILFSSVIPMSKYIAGHMDEEESFKATVQPETSGGKSPKTHVTGRYADLILQDPFLLEHYAGGYMDRDGQYYVCVTSAEAQTAFQKAIGSQNASTKILIKSFSYWELSSIVEVITKQMFELNVVAVGIKQQDNVVDVLIEEADCAERVLSYLHSAFPDFNEKAVRFFVEGIAAVEAP